MNKIKLPKEVIDLLNQSSAEIRNLRGELNVTKMRLEIYDNMIALHKGNNGVVNYRGGHPDPVFEIQRILQNAEVDVPETNKEESK